MFKAIRVRKAKLDSRDPRVRTALGAHKGLKVGQVTQDHRERKVKQGTKEEMVTKDLKELPALMV